MRTRLKATLTGMLLTMLCAGVAPAAAHAEFGIASFQGSVTANEAGVADTQAGSHPFAVTTSFTFNTTNTKESTGTLEPDGQVRGIQINLPPGLIGDPAATPRCAQALLSEGPNSKCPKITQVGTDTLSYIITSTGVIGHATQPVYNVVPPPGVPAEFAFRFLTNTIPIYAGVRTGGDYGVTMSLKNIAQALGVVGSSTTFWGVPANKNEGGGSPTPFITLPTECHESGEAITMRAESWQGAVSNAEAALPAVKGCDRVPFTPSLSVEPDVATASSPAGFSVDLSTPQNANPSGLGEANLDDAEVKLPAGLSVNPAAASGLAGCPLEGADGVNLHSPDAAGCPDSSKIGTVKIKTPLLEEEMSGGVYLAQQGNMGPGIGSNPFGSLLAIYVVAEGSGVRVKLAGKVEANPITGQLTTTFDENPQLPFEHLKLNFFGGERAPLSTPSCGTYSASAKLTPYSLTDAVSVESQPFTISSGCGGGFAPTLQAGTINPQAGSFSPFTMTLRRNDGEQVFRSVSLTLPDGMAGMISKVTPCSEAQASANECPAASQIGQVTVQAGVGSEPVTLPQAGKPADPVYLTGPYEGAPFGLLIVVPAEAGPFNLGKVMVRARLEVNPATAQVSVVSKPIETIKEGIPLDVKTIHVAIDKEGFIFNPTSCASQKITGTIGSAEGAASAAVSAPSQAANCAALPFKPSFTASVLAHHTKTNGESLRVGIKLPAGEANIAKVHVTLPKKLPSRLQTLKLACSAAQFAANPAGCPSGSVVGSATVQTPVLPVPMQGSAIFVSHGGAGFPNLDLVLQGDGVKIVLVGETLIQRGITTSTFATVPDMPVSSVLLSLPPSEHSALAGNGNLCAAPLYMPTAITAQNGAVFTQRTKIAVSGCKPQIRVIGKRVKGASASLSVSLPGPGTLTASGHGIERSSLKAGRAGSGKLRLRASQKTRQLLAGHPRRRLKVEVHLRFVPSHGKPIVGQTTVLIG